MSGAGVQAPVSQENTFKLGQVQRWVIRLMKRLGCFFFLGRSTTEACSFV